jgi:DHA3 family tetracycline resistance protein-like MFS transporter
MQKPNAYQIYLLVVGISALASSTIFSISAVYYVQTVRMDPLQLVLVGTVLELTAFIFEVPTGVVADKYSRRLSVIAGYFLLGAGFMLEGAVPAFVAILGAQVVTGIGYTFISGAQDAWIVDEIGVEHIGQIYARGQQANNIGALVGIFVGTGLALLQLSLPILLGGLLMIVLAVALVIVMPEHGFKPAPNQERTWQSVGRILHDGTRVIRGNSLLMTLMAAALVFGAFSEGIDRLWQAHFLTDVGLPALGALQPVAWFGVINVVGMLLNMLAAEFVRRRVDMTGKADTGRILFVMQGAMGLSVIAFGLAGNFVVAIIAKWLISLLRTASGPLSGTWMNQNIRSEVRATVLSMNGQADALGQVAGGPVIGAIGSAFSMRAALVFSGLLIAPALALYTRTFKPRGAQPALAPQDDGAVI